MSHPPQASLSSSARPESSSTLPRTSNARFEERLDESASPRTRTADGRSSEERVSEEQAFERAAAQLRPAWATGQARQYLVAASANPPISGTTALPAPATAPSPVSEPAPAAVVRSRAPDNASTAATAPSAASRDSEVPDEIELSDAIYEGEPLLEPQPVYAASHSNFPAQPFDVGVTPSTQFRSRHIARPSADDTADFSQIAGKRPLNVRLLAIGAAACLAIGSVWALASGDDSPAESNGAAATSVQPKPATPPAAAAPVAPTSLPAGRELPDSLLPSRSREAAAPHGTSPAGADKAATGDRSNKADAKATSKSRKAAERAPAAPVKKTSIKAAVKGTSTKSVVPTAPKGKAQPTVKAKPATKSRGRGNDVVDPWGK